MTAARAELVHTIADVRRRGPLDTERHQVVIRDAERLVESVDGDELA
jgi:hypothetical protein